MLIRLLFIYLILVIYFMQDAVGAEVYEKKGYSRFKGALWSLIPVYGLYVVFHAPAIKQVPPGSFRRFFSLRELFMKFITFGELVLLATLVLLPIIYVVGSAFAATEEGAASLLPTSFWPKRLTVSNFTNLISKFKFWYWYKNTFLIALLNMIGGVVFITGAAYVFARFKFKGKKMGLIAILVLQVFPSFMGMIAMYSLFETFNLLGRPIALTILYVGGAIPFNIWLIKGYLQQIPRDLDESAMLDGANKLQIFFHIILPLSVPILSFVAVSQFMAPWMDYILPKFILDINIPGSTGGAEAVQKQWTLAVGLFSMISSPDKQNYTMFAAGALIVAFPITLLYMIFQRFLIEGITAGATKG